MNQEINESIKTILDSLPSEQKEKAMACRTAEEFIQFASDAGIALPDELLDAVAGGSWQFKSGLQVDLQVFR